MSISPHDLLHHIIDEINFLVAEAEIQNKNSFLADEKAKRAFVTTICAITALREPQPAGGLPLSFISRCLLEKARATASLTQVCAIEQLLQLRGKSCFKRLWLQA